MHTNFFLLHIAIPPVVTAVNVPNARAYLRNTSNVVLKFDLIDSTFPTCELHFSNIQWTYTTEKGSEIINTSFPANNRYIFSDDLLSLTITNLQEADDGNYTLMATNNAGNSSATFNLAVYSKAIYACMQLHYIIGCDFIKLI